MSDRLPSRVVATALIRRVNDAGGMATVLARGDDQAGALLILALERGANPRFYERGLGPDGRIALIESGPKNADSEAIETYWRKRRKGDPDLWVIELDVAQAERFAAETIVNG